MYAFGECFFFNKSAARCAVALVAVACVGFVPCVRAVDIVVDTNNLIVCNDGDGNDQQIKGVPFVAAVEDGIARFYIRGDVSLAAGERLIPVGSRPASLVVGGNAMLGTGSTVEVSGQGPSGGAGGGNGGTYGGGGAYGYAAGGVQGGNGGPGGTGTIGNGNPGGPGSGWYNTAQVPGGAGGSGSAGQPGVNSPGGGGSPGSGGTAGASGVCGGFAGGGAGGYGGIDYFFYGSNGGPGDDGVDGIHGTGGERGGDGQPGGQGSNTGTGDMISGGGGGGGGGGAGGGGGGGAGSSGTGGGGGGAGGGSGTIGVGGNGGNGGSGGQSGSGGWGGPGGGGGSGGGGGGAVEIYVCGRMQHASDVNAKGGDGQLGGWGGSGGPYHFFQSPTDGVEGSDGAIGGSNNGNGGHGGHGGNGGWGADGGDGGNGMSGGGGAGGTVKLVASTIQGDSNIDICGGYPYGGVGRFLFGTSTGQPFGGYVQCAGITSVNGPLVTNPFIAGDVKTPYIPGATGGPEAFGLLDGITTEDLAAVVYSAPRSARAALVRYDVGPTGFDDDYVGFDMLLYINLSTQALSTPTLHVGSLDPAQQLLLGGYTRRTEFGGAGLTTLDSLPAGAVYGVLVPEDTHNYTFGYTGAAETSRTETDLIVSQAIYLPNYYMTLYDDEDFTTDCTNPTPGGTTGWTPLSSYQVGQATDYDTTGGALRVTIATGAVPRINGWVTANSEWMPYSEVGSDNCARAKFLMFRSSQANMSDLNQVPNMRLRLTTRFAMSSILEVFNHLTGDATGTSAGRELCPKSDPTSPSIYRVDLDPVDVPALTAAGEGISRGFEAYSLEPQENGAIEMTESMIGTYPLAACPDTGPDVLAEKTFAVSTSDAGDLKVFNSLTDGPFVRKFVLLAPGMLGSEVALDGATDPTCAESATGVTMDTRLVATNRVGLVIREFTELGANTARIRVERDCQYKVRWHMTASTNANRNPQVRFRARAIKFMWAQKLEIGGALAAGSLNNTIAQQALPGIGCMNTDQQTPGECGGWYTMWLHTPLSRDILESQPVIEAQPGPGSASNSMRDIKFGLDVLDTLSGMASSAQENGCFTLDRMELRAYGLIDD